MNRLELATILKVSAKAIKAWEYDESIPSTKEWRKFAETLKLPATPEDAKPNRGVSCLSLGEASRRQPASRLNYSEPTKAKVCQLLAKP